MSERNEYPAPQQNVRGRLDLLEEAIRLLAMDAECSEEQLISEAFGAVGRAVPELLPHDHVRPDATEIGASISRKYHSASTVPLNLAAMIAEAIEADRAASPHDHLRASTQIVHRLCELHDRLLRVLDAKVGIKVFSAREVSDMASLVLDAATELDQTDRAALASAPEVSDNG